MSDAGEQVTADEAGDRTATVVPFPSTAPTPPADAPIGLRDALGSVLRDERRRQDRTLADVAETAAVSLPYLSEVERGRKDVSADVLTSVADALGIGVPEVLERTARRLRVGVERRGGVRLLAA